MPLTNAYIQPMKHSTPIAQDAFPQEATLNFLRAFARLYDPIQGNPSEALHIARHFAYSYCKAKDNNDN